MLQIVISIVAFLVAISILVVIHESGHFGVARFFGIKVLRFSVGFGKPFYRFYDRLGTEYCLSWIPLGGYVSLLGMQGETVSASERPMAFDAKPVWQRMLVLAAGPMANFLLAIALYWIVFMWGVSSMVPILGFVPKDSAAGLAGLAEGQEIVSIEHQPTPNWEAISIALIKNMGDEKQLIIGVQDPKAGLVEKRLDLNEWSTDSNHPDWLGHLGLSPMDPRPAIVARVLPDSPALRAGVLAGDRIVAVDGNLTASCSGVIQIIQAHPNRLIPLGITRYDQLKTLSIRPESKASAVDQQPIGFIGVEFQMPSTPMPASFFRMQRFGPLIALQKAIHKTWDYSVLSLGIFKKMLLGKVSTRQVSGPLSIAKYAGQSARGGFQYFLDFLAMISISLAVLNILPIPLLDGGQLAYCVYECVMGRRLPLFVQKAGTWLGALALAGLMSLAFYNDWSAFFG